MATEQPCNVLWSAPLLNRSGYGEESRALLLALHHAGVPVAAHHRAWDANAELSPEEAVIRELLGRPLSPGFIHVCHDLGGNLDRHPQALAVAGRTMFETDRLPRSWVNPCNRMNALWLPSRFNAETFVASGVRKELPRVVPPCLPAEFLTAPTAGERKAARQRWETEGRKVVTSVFDWTLRKGWDLLLPAFFDVFGADPKALLMLRVGSSMGYTPAALWGKIEESALGAGCKIEGALEDRIRFLWDPMPRSELRSLYLASDVFALPTRGEGWCRPGLEALALGLPAIVTGWGGQTDYLNAETGLPLRYRLTAVPRPAWEETSTYRGHRWAEPDPAHLRELLAQAVALSADRKAANTRAQIAAELRDRYSPQTIAALLKEELTRLDPGTNSTPPTNSPPQESHPRSPLGPGTLDLGPKKPSALGPGTLDLGPETTSPLGPGTWSLEPASSPSESQPRSPLGLGTLDLGLAEPLRLRLEGAFFNHHSLAKTNRNLAHALIAAGVEVSLVPNEPAEYEPEEGSPDFALKALEFAPLSGPADAHVRHCFPPRWDRPEEGRFILIQPWEFGALPEEWVDLIRQWVDEVWCYTEYVRQVYLASGVPAEKLLLLPLGIDPEIYNPNVLPYVLTTDPLQSEISNLQPPISNLESPPSSEAGQFAICNSQFAICNSEENKPFTLLTVGATIARKGIEEAIAAYLRAFSADDPVRWIAKDTGGATVYRGQTAREQLLALSQDPTRPRIDYLEEELDERELAGLYAIADVVLLPYRGEGFCLPALEAMACGTPVIVPEGGATDDFVDDTVGWRIPAKRVPLPGGEVGGLKCAAEPWWLEVDPAHLARTLRHIAGLHGRETAAARAELQEKAAAAAHRAKDWTWSRTAQLIKLRLLASKSQPAPAPPTDHPESGVTQNASRSRSRQSAKSAKSVATSGSANQQSKISTHQSEIPPLSASSASLRLNPDQNTHRLQRISICMIVRNEERVLAECLRSIAPLAWEIIIVDTGSTDRTVEIAESFGAKVYHFPWINDFAAARNESLKYATGDWIMWVDADDTLPPECLETIRHAVYQAPPEIIGFIIPIQFLADAESGGATRVDHLKLFRNVPGVKFVGRIHEQVLESLNALGGQIARCDAYLLHSGYDTSPEGQARKRERDKTILELELKERGDHPFVLFNLGMTAHHNHEHEDAIKWLTRSIKVSQPHESHVRKTYAMLGVSRRELGDREAALQTFLDGLKVAEGDPELHFHAAHLLTELQRFDEAREHYLKVPEADIRGHFSSVDVGILGFKTFHNLAAVCLALGKYDEAREWFRKSIAHAPEHLPSAFELFNAALDNQDWATAEEMLAFIRRLPGQELSVQEMGARYQAVRSGLPIPTAVSVERDLEQARQLLNSGEVEQAQPLLMTAANAGSAEAAYYLGVIAVQSGDLRPALQWMERSLALNPDHAPTADQVKNLRKALQDPG